MTADLQSRLADYARTHHDGEPATIALLAEFDAQGAGGGAVAWNLPAEGAYLIRYDDADMPDELISMAGARDAALYRYKQVSVSWNAHLFVKIDSNSRAETTPNASLASDFTMEDAEKMCRVYGYREQSAAGMLAALNATFPKGRPAGEVGALKWALDAGGVTADWCNVAGDALRELMAAYERRVRSLCTPEEIERKPWECAEFIQAREALARKPAWVATIPAAPAAVVDEGMAVTGEKLEKATAEVFGYVFNSDFAEYNAGDLPSMRVYREQKGRTSVQHGRDGQITLYARSAKQATCDVAIVNDRRMTCESAWETFQDSPEFDLLWYWAKPRNAQLRDDGTSTLFNSLAATFRAGWNAAPRNAIAPDGGEDARDAARYRWLRSKGTNWRHGDPYILRDETSGDGIYDDAADAAIDEAMQQRRNPTAPAGEGGERT